MTSKKEPKLGLAIILLGTALFVFGVITLFNTGRFDAWLVVLVGVLAWYIGRFIQRGFVVHFYIFGFFPVFLNPFNFSPKTHKSFLILRLMMGSIYGIIILYTLVSNDFKLALQSLVG